MVAVEASVAKLSPADRASILNQSLAHFRNPSGPDLLKRTERFNDFIQSRAEFGLWRLLPTSMLERLVGRMLVAKAFKPLSADIPVPLAA